MKTFLSKDRHQIIRNSSIFGLIENCFLFVIKLFIGFFSRSFSLISDAFNNLSDLLTSLITLGSSVLASKPADENHPYGHGRSEYIATQFVAFLIIYVGITLIIQSFNQIRSPQQLDFSVWLYLVLILSIVIKLGLMLYNQQLNKQTDSDLLEAVVVDARNDVISSVLLLIILFVQPLTKLPLDAIAGLVLSIIILWSGLDILKQSMSKLLGKKIDQEVLLKIDQIITQHPQVLGYHNLKGHDYGPEHVHLSIDLELPDTMDLVSAHKIVDQIEREIYACCKIDAVAHIDPISSDEQLNEEMSHLVRNLVEGIISFEKITQLSCVRGHYRTSLFLTLDCESDSEFNEVKEKIIFKVKESYPNLSFHIENH